jgi:hypothetical protein
MPPTAFRGAGVLALLCACLLAACTFPPARGPTPDQVTLRQSDVSTGWSRCGWSGGIDGYLGSLRQRDPASAQQVQQSWDALKGVGAENAQVTGFSQAGQHCDPAPGSGAGPSATSWVASYRDTDAARAGYRKGVLGFPTPTQEREQPGLEVGVATGLGRDAWTLAQTQPPPQVYLAWWREGSLTVFLVTVGVAEDPSRTLARQIDGRMTAE